MSYKDLPPSASLTASMRNIGYSLETAVADLIDNSISADATDISVFCVVADDNPTFVIIDNSKGMRKQELTAAMRYGNRNATDNRAANSLGRFGLGMKTASFSQCRCLTVATRQNGKYLAAEWDLDRIDKKNRWLLKYLDKSEIMQLPFIEYLPVHGTIIVWRKPDRLFEGTSGQRRQDLVNGKLDVVRHHLSLVFHRFIAGEVKGRPRIKIRINGHELDSFDPFCRDHKTTQVLAEEIVQVRRSRVRIQPYILPHHSKLSQKEYEYYQDHSEFTANQGMYIYREGRLLSWGSWDRLIPKGETTKLCRVQIDFPNNLDHDWSIDIKKSRAALPPAVRDRMKQIIQKISGQGIKTHTRRTKKLSDNNQLLLWNRYPDNNHIYYAINQDHPLIQSMLHQSSGDITRKFRILLDAISSALPVEGIYIDYSRNTKRFKKYSFAKKDVQGHLKSLKSALDEDGTTDAKKFMEILDSTCLFDEYRDDITAFVREEFDEYKPD